MIFAATLLLFVRHYALGAMFRTVRRLFLMHFSVVICFLHNWSQQRIQGQGGKTNFFHHCAIFSTVLSDLLPQLSTILREKQKLSYITAPFLESLSILQRLTTFNVSDSYSVDSVENQLSCFTIQFNAFTK